mmetsp:Transcript_30219/g.100981  ORF Transcript_30219/g.100981 Transcript_30219/m.100981 type:complete len:248 (+) Transcript_30219:270-1013(+)
MSSARVSVMPCALCTVSAHASLSGNCTRATAPPGPGWKVDASLTCSRAPLSKRTTGERTLPVPCGTPYWSPESSSSKPTTTPREPLTRRASGKFLLSITCAPTLRRSSAGLFFSTASSSRAAASAAGAPPPFQLSIAANSTAPPGSAARCLAFSSSTAAFLQYSLVGRMPSVGGGLTSMWHAASAAHVAAAHWPTRTSLRMRMKAWSPACRTMVRSAKVRTAHARHARPSKVKPAPSRPSETGGSWK